MRRSAGARRAQTGTPDAAERRRYRSSNHAAHEAVLLNSPGNPSGAVTPLSELERIADVCIRHDIWAISDEVYHPFVFDGSASIAPSIAAVDGMHERTVVVESLSKTFAMTGWRIGYLLGPEPLIEQTSKLAELMHSSVNSTAQYAAVAALTARRSMSRPCARNTAPSGRSCWTSSTAAPRCA